MSKSILSLVSLVALTIALVSTQAQAATVNVNQFSAVFPTVSASGIQFTLTDEITSTAPGTAVGLSVDPITVDLTGWNPAGLGISDTVSIVGGQITLSGSSGSATYDVASASLTQILNNPISVGYIELSLNNLVNSSLKDGNGDDVALASALTTTITINGLKVTTNGINGNASIPTLSTASLTAVPEPSSIVLGVLGFGGLGLVTWRRRGRKSNRS